MVDLQSSGLPRRSLWRRRVAAQSFSSGEMGCQPPAAGNLPGAIACISPLSLFFLYTFSFLISIGQRVQVSQGKSSHSRTPPGPPRPSQLLATAKQNEDRRAAPKLLGEGGRAAPKLLGEGGSSARKKPQAQAR